LTQVYIDHLAKLFAGRTPAEALELLRSDLAMHRSGLVTLRERRQRHIGLASRGDAEARRAIAEDDEQIAQANAAIDVLQDAIAGTERELREAAAASAEQATQAARRRKEAAIEAYRAAAAATDRALRMLASEIRTLCAARTEFAAALGMPRDRRHPLTQAAALERLRNAAAFMLTIDGEGQLSDENNFLGIASGEKTQAARAGLLEREEKIIQDLAHIEPPSENAPLRASNSAGKCSIDVCDFAATTIKDGKLFCDVHAVGRAA
jgi:hypothetical protein